MLYWYIYSTFFNLNQSQKAATEFEPVIFKDSNSHTGYSCIGS